MTQLNYQVVSHMGAARGTSLIEVLMAIFVLTIGLLGLAGLQGKANTAELESYQRGQALILLQDMATRMENNTGDVTAYATGAAAPLGTGATDAAACASEASRAAIDKCEWSKALKGASETLATVKQGAMINGRGCIEEVTAGREYTVSVVWQGLAKTSTPSTTACGAGSYDSVETRRVITTTVRIPDLTAS
jgi:type IV pilus assembly protein PilV